MAKKPHTGDFCKLCCDTGTAATPALVEWGEIDGCTCSDLSRSITELNVRMLNAKPALQGKINSLTFTFKYYPGFSDTNYETLINDFFHAAEPKKWSMLDENGDGLVMPAFVESIAYNQPAGEAVSHDVTLRYGFLKEGENILEPEWITAT